MKFWTSRNSNPFAQYSLWLVWAVVALTCFILIKPYLSTAFPYTHDGENHLARFANYKVAIREGQFPPRFAPNLVNHYGYPVFNYNYPLANIASLPFSVLGMNYELTFKILATFAILSAGAGSYFWLRSQKFSSKLALLGSAVIFSTPFFINLTYFRGNIGELFVLGVFPWLLLDIRKLKSRAKPLLWASFWVIDVTLFLLSHNISVLFGGFLLFLYMVFEYRRSWQDWKRIILLSIVPILLTLWFWLPALAEKQFIVLDQADLSSQFSNHFLEWSQLLAMPFQFGYSYLTLVDTLNLSLGITTLFGMVIGGLLVLKSKPVRKKYGFYFLVSLLLVFLQLPFSQRIWEIIPLAHFIQFPWRLSLFLMFFSLPLVVLATKHIWLRRLVIGILIFQAISLWSLRPADTFHKSNIDYDLFSQSTSTLNENLPVGFTYTDFADWQPKPSVLAGVADIVVHHWDGTSRNYSLDVKENNTIIVEPTMNFPGWETVVEEEPIEYLRSEEIAGRIAYSVDIGSYDIKTRFTQNTWPRRVGNFVSLLSLLGIIGWGGWQGYRYYVQSKK